MKRPQHCDQHKVYRIGCDDCRAVSRKWERARARERAYRGPIMVPAYQATEHMRRLTGMGVSVAAIARAAGLSQSAAHNVWHGKRGTIHRNTHNQIMGVSYETAEPEDGYRPAIGLTRKVQHLFFMGWTGADIARRVGVEQGHIYRIAEGANRTVDKGMYDRTAAVYRQLCHTDGGSVRAKNTAARNGWVSIYAYDNPDDPRDKPKGVAA